MAIWLSFLLIFCLLTSCYLFFLFKKKINKWQWLFISYYFLLAVGVNTLKSINISLISMLSLSNFASQVIAIKAIISLTVIIFAILATFFTAKFKQRKLYIWWFHIWLLLTCCLVLIVANVWTLILLNVALGMSTASLGVHELMFNEQYFAKSHAFLTFTILIVPGLLASLIVVPINILIINVTPLIIIKINYFIISSLCFIILTFFLSFWLREKPKNMGTHEQIVLKKIKTFSHWKIIGLIIIGLVSYLIYYLMNSNFFNYKVNIIERKLISYKLLFTILPQVSGVFLLGWWLYYFFNANIVLYFGFIIFILAIIINLVTINIYLLLISQILSNIAFGVCSFVIYSLVLDWNYRQLMPITGIYAAFIASLTCGIDIIDGLSDYDLIIVNDYKIIFYIGHSIAILAAIGLILTTIFSANYWVTEKHDVLIEIKQIEAKRNKKLK